MKIGIIHNSMEPFGGAEQTTLSMMRAFRNTSHHVTLHTTTKDIAIPAAYAMIMGDDHTYLANHRVSRVKIPIPIRGVRKIFENKFLFRNARKEDMVIISDGGLNLPEFRKNIVLYLHSTFYGEDNHVKIKIKLGRIHRTFVQKNIKDQLKRFENNPVKCISNSEFTRHYIRERFGKDSVVIYPPVTYNPILSNSDNESSERRKGVITVARFSPEKNLLFCNDVMRRVDDEQYTIFGSVKYASQKQYYKDLQQQKGRKTKLNLNLQRMFIDKGITSAKVYFHGSAETFGIAVVEGILAGCVPIVPDNSANKETVPFDELRYKENDADDAYNKIRSALDGRYDKYLSGLKEHVKKFSEGQFKKNIIEYAENFRKTK